MAGNRIFRGPTDRQFRTVSKPVAGAYLPGTFVEETATQLAQITTAVAKRPLLLMNVDHVEQGVADAYTSGKRLPVGEIIDVEGDVVPPSLVNKVRPVAEVERPRGKAKAKAPEFTREHIAELDEAYVDELLASHGVTAEGASLDDKRAALIQIMFVDA